MSPRLTHTIDRSEARAVAERTAATAPIEVATLLAEGRPDAAPLLPTQVRRLASGWAGAEWVRAVADYQDSPSVGYASIEDLCADHQMPAGLDLEWVTR